MLAVELGQVAVLARRRRRCSAGTRTGASLDVAVLLVVGTAAFSGLGLLMAGTLRAEATLAGANLVWLLLFVGGGIVVPLDQLPDGRGGRAGLPALGGPDRGPA